MDKKVKELQDNIAAVNFTPQSKMGEMLMAKCTTLVEENEEIGNQASEGKVMLYYLLYDSITFFPFTPFAWELVFSYYPNSKLCYKIQC